MLGINILVLVCAKEKIFKSAFISNALVIVSLLMMLILGARGPLLFCLFLLFLFVANKYIKPLLRGEILFPKLRIILYGLVVVIGFVAAFVVFRPQMSFLLGRSLMRLELLMPFSSGSETVPKNMGKSVNVRIEQLNYSLDLISDNFENSMIGYGIGSFGVLYDGKDSRNYPHNILLEIWVEAGLIGLMLFLTFLIIVFTKNIRGINYIHILVLIFILLNALKSNSYIDIRVYFAVFGMFMLSSNSRFFTKESNLDY
ncbi:MAG: O-antigen ligase family protein [Bacteroidales bacterium]|nr:O-antigen ligase family protein [Bacteroidales bacterium]